MLNGRLTEENKFAGSSIVNVESVIDERLLDWLCRVHRSWVSEAEEYVPFDIGKRIQYLTVDIITQVCLGKEVRCVTTDSDRYDFLANRPARQCILPAFLSVFLEMNKVMSCLTKIPIIGPMVIPGPSDKSGVGRIMRASFQDLRAAVRFLHGPRSLKMPWKSGEAVEMREMRLSWIGFLIRECPNNKPMLS